MKKAGEVFAELAKRAGLQHTSDNLKEILALTTPIPDEVEQALNSLMNAQEAESWAKGQSSVKNHFTAQAYNGWDKKLIESADKLGFTDEEKDRINGERNTGKRQDIYNEILENRIAEAKKDQTGAKKAGDADAEAKIKKEIDELRAALRAKDEEKEKIISEKDSHFKEYVRNAKIDSVLNSQKWSENYPAELRTDMGRIAINKHLEKEGAQISLDEKGEIKLVRLDNPELPYFDNSNKNPNFAQLAAKVLADNKFLAVSTQTANTNTKIPVIASNGSQSNTNKRSNSVSSLLQQSLKDQQG